MHGRRAMAWMCAAAAVGLTAGAPLRAAAAQAVDETPPEVAEMAGWVLATGDNHDLPFVIVDKVDAEVFVYAPDGWLRGAAPVLLGLARGDDSAPGVGDKDLSAITPEERTTPAGRFVAGFGPARGGENVLWIDFATAISMHAVVNSNPAEHRLERLASPTVEDNRISYGCINVPAGFYEDVVRRTFTGTRGVVYILPETRSLAETFPGFTPSAPQLAEQSSPDRIADMLREAADGQATGAGAADALHLH